jgi:hypothetical protein
MKTIYRVHVQMGPSEWAGNDDGRKMENIAREVFEQYRHLNTEGSVVVVEVWEHGGWFLHFAEDENICDPLIIVGTANDRAQLSERANALGRRFQGAKTEYLPSIRREDRVVAKSA